MVFDLSSINSLIAILSALAGVAAVIVGLRGQVVELGRRVEDLAVGAKNLTAAVGVCESSLLELENKILRELMEAERRHEEKFVTLAESAASLADMRRRLENLEHSARK